MSIYLDNGYINMQKIFEYNAPFTFVIGARRTGKTYGAFYNAIMNKDTIPFGIMRRTSAEMEIMTSPEYNPFRELNNDYGWNYGIFGNPATKKRTANVYNQQEKEGILEPYGEAIAPVFALSTFASVRGFGGANIDRIIYDEFIPENHVRKIRDEGAALMNLYETINGNRELKGKKPLQLICLANSNKIDNEVLVSFGLVNTLINNRKRGQEIYYNKKSGILVVDVQNSPISKKKADTALYKATKNAKNGFREMALENEFPEFSKSKYRSLPLYNLNPIVTVGEITVYKIKGSQQLYCSTHKSGNPESYGTSDLELERFGTKYIFIRRQHLLNNIIFEDINSEILLDKYFTR